MQQLGLPKDLIYQYGTARFFASPEEEAAAAETQGSVVNKIK
jgi:hypothetical protein